MPAAAELARQHQCGVLLAERAVGADGEQTLAAALAAGRDRNSRRRAAHVDQSAAETPCGGVELAIVGEACVHAADDIEPGFERLDQRRHPFGVQRAAAIGDADDERLRAARVRLGRFQTRQAGSDRRSRQRVFADAFLGRPVAQAERRLRVRRLGDVAEKQQVRARNVDGDRRPGRCALLSRSGSQGGSSS